MFCSERISDDLKRRDAPPSNPKWKQHLVGATRSACSKSMGKEKEGALLIKYLTQNASFAHSLCWELEIAVIAGLIFGNQGRRACLQKQRRLQKHDRAPS